MKNYMQKTWRRGEFLFCFVIIWSTALLQGYGLYQDWRENRATVEAFGLLEVEEIKGYVEIVGVEKRLTCESVNDIEKLLDYKASAERYMRRQGLKYNTYLCLEGSKRGRMSLAEQNEVTDRLFHSLHGEEVEAVREEELYTVYGYSPLFSNSLSYGEREINLNLAYSYDEREKKTVFYLAMPYVKEDY